MTFGLATDCFGKMASKTFLRVHMTGEGKPGNKKPVLFPKLVFLYDKNLHGEGCINEDVFEAGIDCSCKTMYPDWLSLTGDGYVAEMYKKYGRVVSPMGCRAFLSPWYERGGMHPADEDDKTLFDNYKVWCKSNGYYVCSMKKFNAELTMHPEWYTEKSLMKGVTVYRGIKRREG